MNVITRVVSNARKIIMPAIEGAPAVQPPQGAVINSYGADNEGATVWVQNSTDGGTWQGVNFDTGFVIVNNVPEDIALEALRIYGECPTVDSLAEAIEYLAGNGFGDQYTSTWKFLGSKLSPAGKVIGNRAGIYKRDDRDQVEVYQGNGKFYVVHSEGPREIDPNILVATYRTLDGQKISLDDVQSRTIDS